MERRKQSQGPCSYNKSLVTTENLSIHITGWWFGTWILLFHILGIIIPTDFHIFLRGWTTNQITIKIVLAQLETSSDWVVQFPVAMFDDIPRKKSNPIIPLNPMNHLQIRQILSHIIQWNPMKSPLWSMVIMGFHRIITINGYNYPILIGMVDIKDDFIPLIQSHQLWTPMNSEVMGFPGPPQACCRQARPWIFPGRRPIFISARVHPGETPASYMLEGAAFWTWLLSNLAGGRV